MAWDDLDCDETPSECSYWGDGKHHWESDGDSNGGTGGFGVCSTVTYYKRCKCGATDSDVEMGD